MCPGLVPTATLAGVVTERPHGPPAGSSLSLGLPPELRPVAGMVGVAGVADVAGMASVPSVASVAGVADVASVASVAGVADVASMAAV